MSAATPASLRRAKKYFDKSQFDELHEATGKLDFTPDFNPSIEAILTMPDVALTEKLIALVKLQAWGNQRLFAVRDGSRHSPFTEADCARLFGVSRQTINRHAQKLIDRCQLRIDEGKLYPVIDPAAEKRLRGQVVTPGSDSPSPNLRLLKERWFADHPEIHEQYQKAFQFIDTINRQIAADLRAQVSPPGVTTAPEVPEQRGGHENGNGADTPPTPLRTTEPRILTEKKEELEKEKLSPPTPSPAAPPRTELWPGFLFAAQRALMAAPGGQIPAIREAFEELALEERLAAIQGIQLRVDCGQYDEPAFVPGALRYLKEKLWTAPLRVKRKQTAAAKSAYVDSLIAGEENAG